MEFVYLDHAALTPCEPAAQQAVAEALASCIGHHDAAHSAARRTRALIERARSEVAGYLGCDPLELRLYGSGSEALATAIEAVAGEKHGPIVSLGTEHPAVSRALDRHRSRVTLLPATGGEIDSTAALPVLASADIVVLSALNHELGTLPNLTELLPMAPDALWVIDAVQAAAWLDLSPYFRERIFLAFSSQKLGGPSGAAALRVPASVARRPTLGSADGTVISSSVIGFGAACQVRTGQRELALARVEVLGRKLLDGLLEARDGGVHNGELGWLGPIVNVAWQNLSGRQIEHIMDLEAVALARTSACRQRFDDASAIVQAAYPDEAWRARGATRWSLGWRTTETEIDEAIARFAARFGAANPLSP